jgi:2-dehydropantoate 2-reductase
MLNNEYRIPKPNVSASLEEALAQGPYDVAIFALKSFDTQKSLQNITPLAAAIPPVLCLQNGVENEALLAEVLGKDKVIAGTVTSAIGRLGPGNIILERLRGIGISAGHPLSEPLAHALDACGLNAKLYPQAKAMKWSKMLTNLLANATSAILDMPPGDIFAHPGLFKLEIAQLREALVVMRTLGIRTVDLPGTPVRTLAIGVRFLPLFISRPLMQKAVGSGRGLKMPSFHIDLHGGRGKNEVDFLNGAVVRAGKKEGIQTPINHFLNQTLLALTNEEIPLDTFAHQPEKLIESIV